MAYKITGRVFAIGQTQTLTSKSGNIFTKRDLVITVRKFDQYTGQPTDDSGNTPKFTFIGDRCQQLDNVKVGDIVVVYFDISGREYKKDNTIDYITDIRPFKIDVLGNYNTHQEQMASQQPQMNSQPTSASTQQTTSFGTSTSPQAAMVPPAQDDDLPF